MARKSTMVPCNGNRDFVNALNVVAKGKRQTTSELVRKAVDALYGNEIKEAEQFLLTHSGASEYQHSQGITNNSQQAGAGH